MFQNKMKSVRLTNRNFLITADPGQSVSAAAAVVPAEIPVALAGAVEKSNRPPFSIVPTVVGILRPVRPRVHRDGDALSAPCTKTAEIPGESGGRWTTLSAPEPLWCDALSGELGADHHRAHQHRNTVGPNSPKHDIIKCCYARVLLGLPQFVTPIPR